MIFIYVWDCYISSQIFVEHAQSVSYCNMNCLSQFTTFSIYMYCGKLLHKTFSNSCCILSHTHRTPSIVSTTLIKQWALSAETAIITEWGMVWILVLGVCCSGPSQCYSNKKLNHLYTSRYLYYKSVYWVGSWLMSGLTNQGGQWANGNSWEVWLLLACSSVWFV